MQKYLSNIYFELLRNMAILYAVWNSIKILFVILCTHCSLVPFFIKSCVNMDFTVVQRLSWLNIEFKIKLVTLVAIYSLLLFIKTPCRKLSRLCNTATYIHIFSFVNMRLATILEELLLLLEIPIFRKPSRFSPEFIYVGQVLDLWFHWRRKWEEKYFNSYFCCLNFI